MTTICGKAAAESVAVFAPGFPVPAEAVPGVVSVRASNVVKGSRRALESGFPRRSRGRLGSSIGSSDAEAGADVFAVSGAAGAFALSGDGGGLGALPGGAAVGGAGAVSGFSGLFYRSRYRCRPFRRGGEVRAARPCRRLRSRASSTSCVYSGQSLPPEATCLRRSRRGSVVQVA